MRNLSQPSRPYLASLMILLMFASPLSIMAQGGVSGVHPAPAQDYNDPAKADVEGPATIPVANVQYTNPAASRHSPRGTRTNRSEPVSPSIVKDPQPQIVSTFSNPASITFNDATVQSTIAAGSPYPSNIVVSGFVGTIGKVTVTLNNISHTFPDDIELLVVSPNGQKVKLMSDTCGGTDITSQTWTFDDQAATQFANVGPCNVSGTFRPVNNQQGTETATQDQMPSPAPAIPYATVLANFNGVSANGTWSLYVGDDGVGDVGSIAGGWTLNIDNGPIPAPAPGDILISEFRTRGPGGVADEFIELYNNTNNQITVIDATPDGNNATADGWRFDIAQGAASVANVVLAQDINSLGPVVIPARGHFLLAVSPGYSLTAYAAPDITTATAFLPDDAGIGLFRTANAAQLNAGNTLDAVGNANVTLANHFEGTRLTPAGGITTNVEHSYTRKMPNSNNGVPVDTGQNENDFQLVEVNGASLNGRAAALGAPGPEDTTSPIDRTASFGNSLIDTTTPQSSPPNRVRIGSGNTGTMEIRRRFTNNTGQPVTRLRFRVVEITTLNNPSGAPSPQADIRPTNSSPASFTSGSFGAVTALATTIETPPVPGASGGGLNTSLTVAIPGGTLNNGASIDLNFTANVVTAGNFRYFIIIQAIP